MAGRVIPRGFVLSFSTFSLAVFLIIFAQIHFTHMQNIQFDSGDVFRQSTPARVTQDIALDFNELIGQPISIDQNADWATVKIMGRIPSALSTRTNLLRYQTHLFQLGRDSNTNVFLDLNAVILDNNFLGRTDNGLRWKYSLDENLFRVYPSDASFYPAHFDVNIFSDIPYSGLSYVTGLGVSQPLVSYTLNYSDTNSDHNFTSSGILLVGASLNVSITYDINDSFSVTKQIQLGSIEGSSSSTPFGTTLVGSALVPWRYAISYLLPNDSNGTRAGYDVNASIRGRDFNVDTNTIWTYNGQ